MEIKYLTNDILLQLPEEGERHDEGNSQIISNELPGKNGQIKGRPYALNSVTLSCHVQHSPSNFKASSSETRVPASHQNVPEGNYLQSTAKVFI